MNPLRVLILKIKEIAKNLRKKSRDDGLSGAIGTPRQLNPKWEDSDRLVLSKVHVCPIQYVELGTGTQRR